MVYIYILYAIKVRFFSFTARTYAATARCLIWRCYYFAYKIWRDAAYMLHTY